MGYTYHANYVNYCHIARTELLRKYGISDKFLEENGIMLPVIDIHLKYLKPSGYDEELNVKTTIKEMPVSRFRFEYEFTNAKQELVCRAESTLVFVNSVTRKPGRIPTMIYDAIVHEF